MNPYSGEASKSLAEVTHLGQFDILINNSADKNAVKVIQDLVTNDIENHNNPVFSWTRDADKGWNIFVDNMEDPKFVAKRKIITSRHVDLISAIKTKGSNPEKRTIYAMDSVLNEFSLSSSVNRVLDNSEIQSEIQKLGFKGIKFVEPLLAVIDRNSTFKYLYFPYVRGEGLNSDNERVNEAVDKIRSRFEKVKIVPADLRTKQLLYDAADNMLYLLDIEAFWKEI